jgi:hypothetical protein
MSWNVLISQMVAVIVLYIAVILVARRWLSTNTVTRRVGLVILLGMLFNLMVRCTAPAFDASVAHVLALEGIIYACGSMVTAVFVDRRLMFPACAFLLVTLGAIVHPEATLLFRGMSNFLVGIVLAAIWFHDARKARS